MKNITGHILRVSLFLSSFFLTIASLLSTAAAQSEEEMQILQMFYKEKDLVVSATRSPKSISHVAENITVITAREIERMNAHSVAEVLNRIP
ncbi:MAG: TonB-dependent receptor, partial [Deltaproteobacteria bacterium]|nr:TonB-dependent receptor [Deltaproteobacteria bacterium]